MPPTGRGKAGNLPQELTSFVGRKPELADARRLLSESRLVTLTGPGGVGKTRLALRMASLIRRAFADGVWLVEFDHVQDPALVALTVADSLGLREQSGQPLRQALEEHLAERRVLLVLDNCEHLVDAVAKLTDALLRASQDLRILATSREPLGVRGEVALPISPLPVPGQETPLRDLSGFDSISLFTERAAATLPEFGITEDNRADVVGICLRLEGLPLAIELAAVRLRALSPEQVLDRLSDRYRLLTTGPRSAPTRQQTLHACIGLSYDLCTSAEKLLWARLTVFAGVVELDAAEGVCAGDGLAAEDILDLVGSLVDKSILARARDDVTTRYRMLETVREYGAERLAEAGQTAELRRRHRDWYERLAHDAEVDLISPRQVKWQTRLNRELPNTRKALAFCLTERGEAEVGLRMAAALHAYWARGRLSEGRQWLRSALDGQTAPTAGRAKALYTAAFLAGLQGDVPDVTALAEELHDLAARLDDTASRVLATHTAANVGLFTGDLSGAIARYDEVLDQHRCEGNEPRLMEALFGRAFASGMRGDTARAIACLEEMQAVTEPRGESCYRSYALYVLGLVVWLQGDTPRATELIEQSVRLKRLLDDPLSTAFCLEALAWIATGQHRFHRAAVLLGAAESLSQAVDTPTATFPDLLAYHERCERQTRDELGEEAFQTAYQTGMGLTFADAITCALDEQAEETPPPTHAPTPLTRRERQVAELVARGLSNREIATRLVIAQRTAEGHVERILVKLGLSSRAAVAAWLAEHP